MYHLLYCIKEITDSKVIKWIKPANADRAAIALILVVSALTITWPEIQGYKAAQDSIHVFYIVEEFLTVAGLITLIVMIRN